MPSANPRTAVMKRERLFGERVHQLHVWRIQMGNKKMASALVFRVYTSQVWGHNKEWTTKILACSVWVYLVRERSNMYKTVIFFNIRENISKFKKQNKKELWLDNTMCMLFRVWFLCLAWFWMCITLALYGGEILSSGKKKSLLPPRCT